MDSGVHRRQEEGVYVVKSLTKDPRSSQTVDGWGWVGRLVSTFVGTYDPGRLDDQEYRTSRPEVDRGRGPRD